MANTNSPFGFRQYSGLGSSPTYEQVEMLIKSDNATAIFFGDPVSATSAGYVAQSASNSTTVVGIFVGCKYLSVSQKRTVWSNYWPGSDNSGDVTAYVVNDPNARFVVQSDGTGVTQASINANAGFTIGTGNTSNGISGAYLSGYDDTTATLPFRVFGLVTNPPGGPGTASGAYNWVIVGFNSATVKNLTGV